MNLLAHNALRCPHSGGFPLAIVASRTAVWTASQSERAANCQLLRRILLRLDWAVMAAGARDLGLGDRVPAEPTDPAQLSDEAIGNLAEILMEVRVVEAELVSPCNSHRYQVHDGIPNMVVDLATKNVPVGARAPSKTAVVGPLVPVASTTRQSVHGVVLPAHRLYRRRDQKVVCVMHGEGISGSMELQEEAGRLAGSVHALVGAWRAHEIHSVELLGGREIAML
jgi:multifunctional methyltransferase subunit TRM112